MKLVPRLTLWVRAQRRILQRAAEQVGFSERQAATLAFWAWRAQQTGETGQRVVRGAASRGETAAPRTD